MKERIIGAIVLVAVVVLVVPVFLDGPPDHDETVSERVLLPGQSDQKAQTVVLERSRDEPMPVRQEHVADVAAKQAEAVAKRAEGAAEPVGTEQDESRPPAPPDTDAPAPEPGAARPESSAPSIVPAVSATGMFAVQLGSFSNQQNAERLAADLRKQGFAAFLSQLSTPDGELHRVRVGPQKDREAAEEMAARLRKAGHKGRVLPHP